MSNSNPSVESLFNITLSQLCHSMNADTLQYVLKILSPKLCIQIIWKILRVDYHTFPDNELPPVHRGNEIAHILYCENYMTQIPNNELVHGSLEEFATIQQTKFVDHFNFSNYFDLELFFKLVEVTNCRNKLFTIFQICIQIKGFQLPNNFAEEWIKIQINNNNQGIYFHHIEQGLKLGIFLGDAGWLNECALVLSHTYQIITTKWVCLDRNLELLKIIQCLTKWLLVVSNYHNIGEAKVVLQHMLHTINIIEQIKERTLCIAYAYVAVSQYFYVLREFDLAWSWALKAIRDLRKNSGILKVLVLSHAIKVCSVLNKFKTAKQLKCQLNVYKEEVDEYIYVDILLNDASYLSKVELREKSFDSFYVALDYTRNIFGYFNLRTATILIDYAYALLQCNNLENNIYNAFRSIIQSKFIMKKIGLHNENLLYLTAGRIHAILLIGGLAFNIVTGNIVVIPDMQDHNEENEYLITLKQKLLKFSRDSHLFELLVTVKLLGQNSLITANSYINLGINCKDQKKYKESEEMYLKGIQIQESFLGERNPEVAMSLCYLGHLYVYHLNKLNEAEQLYLRSKTIYETACDGPYRQFECVLDGLAAVYQKLNNIEKFNHITDYKSRLLRKNNIWFNELQSQINGDTCKKDNLSPEKFKCILNGCICDK